MSLLFTSSCRLSPAETSREWGRCFILPLFLYCVKNRRRKNVFEEIGLTSLGHSHPRALLGMMETGGLHNKTFRAVINYIQ
jgi:hypothetical protein